jgi:hypothetical protein
MQSFYTVYFNDGASVVPLFYIDGYTAADEKFTDTASYFVKRFYPGDSRTPNSETPFIVKKYEEPAAFIATVYADYTFKKGIVFAKKMHEAVVYEKVHFPGKIRDSYEVKCVGRIGVLCQTQEMPEQDRSYIDGLKLQIDQRDKIVAQQELMIKRLEADVARLERQVAAQTEQESPKFFANPLYDFSSSPVPVPPPPPVAAQPEQPRSKAKELARRGQINGNVLKELEEIATLSPTSRRERRERERQERQRKKRKEEKRREREREEKRLAQAEEDTRVLDLLIKEISEFGIGYTGGC